MVDKKLLGRGGVNIRCNPMAVASLLLCFAMGATGCSTVLYEVGKKAREDRITDLQFTDTQIGATLLSGLSDENSQLLLDVNADVWELRVLLTGTVSDTGTRRRLVKMARADKRIKKIYDEIQVVTLREQAQRREAKEDQEESQTEGVKRVVKDYWTETKIFAKLFSTPDVVSVNYRWRTVRKVTYIIGRSQNQTELNTVLALIRDTDGVSQIKSFVEVNAS
jgi:osmotically-inducible protein OsmY